MISYVFFNFVIFCGPQFNYLHELDTGLMSTLDLDVKISVSVDGKRLLTTDTELIEDDNWIAYCYRIR
jgi:hypothetical protein